MNSYSYIRCAVRTSVCVAASLAAAVSFGAAADRQKAQAQILDHAEFPCTNCFFGPSDHYYCFAVDNKILIGYQRAPVMNWQDNSKNYLTMIHQEWETWTAPGETVPISYDDKHIWVKRPEGKQPAQNFWGHMRAMANWIIRSDIKKEARLTRSSMRDMFINNDRCRGADGAKGH